MLWIYIKIHLTQVRFFVLPYLGESYQREVVEKKNIIHWQLVSVLTNVGFVQCNCLGFITLHLVKHFKIILQHTNVVAKLISLESLCNNQEIPETVLEDQHGRRGSFTNSRLPKRQDTDIPDWMLNIVIPWNKFTFNVTSGWFPLSVLHYLFGHLSC